MDSEGGRKREGGGGGEEGKEEQVREEQGKCNREKSDCLREGEGREGERGKQGNGGDRGRGTGEEERQHELRGRDI